jgi:GAF domain-containing protein
MAHPSALTPPRFVSTLAAKSLISAVQQLSQIQTLEEVIAIVKKTARRMARADGASFVLRDGHQCFYADEDAVEPLWKGKRFPMEMCISGWVMRQHQPALIPDVFRDERIPHDVYRRTFVTSMAMVPIRVIKPIGAIGIYWKEANSPTVETVRWLQSLADSTALALEHLVARQEIAAARRETRLLEKENAELRQERQGQAAGDCVKMCFITRRIQWSGQWLPVEAFLERRFGLHVTHGLSEDGVGQLDVEEDDFLDLSTVETSG